MEIPGVNKSEEGVGGDGRGYEPLGTGKGRNQEQPEPRSRETKDVADLTTPEKACLRLLRERILKNAHVCAGSAKSMRTYLRVPSEDPLDPGSWAELILNDLNLILSYMKNAKGEEEARKAVIRAFKAGVEETLDIFSEIGEKDLSKLGEKVALVVKEISERLVGAEGGIRTRTPKEGN